MFINRTVFSLSVGLLTLVAFSACDHPVQTDEENAQMLEDVAVTPERPVLDEYTKGILLLVEKRDEKHHKYDNDLVVLDPETGEEFLLSSLGVASLRDVTYDESENKLYFIDDSYGLSYFDLTSKKIYSVDIPELGPLLEEGMQEFFLTASGVVYLRGGCGDEYSCDLLQYNWVTGEQRLLLKDVPGGINSGFRLVDSLSNDVKIYFTKGSGDGPFSEFTLYEVNVDNPELLEVDSYSMDGTCTEETLGSDEYCTEQRLADNKKYEKKAEELFPSPVCSYATVNGNTITAGEKSFNVEDSTFLYCK